MSTKGRPLGFTLVEILVALTIGLFLLAGMIQMYVSNKQTFRFSQTLSQMQENGRYALALIARDMRMADFWGCSRGEDIRVHLNAGCQTPDATSTNAMAGQDGLAGTPDQPDSITLRGSVGAGLAVTDTTPGPPAEINVAGTVGNARQLLGKETDSRGDIALVADCHGGDLFQVTDYLSSPTAIQINTGTDTGLPGNATSVSHRYDQTAAVYHWREARYWIQQGQNGANALFLQEDACAGGPERETVEGVENLQIAYGEDLNGDGTADRYVPRTNVTNMDAVVSVRVNLLLASAQDNLVDQPQQISFDDYDDTADDVFTAPDHRLYQVMGATFAVRNRSL